MRIEDGTVRVSKVFHWFREDFALGGDIGEFITDYRLDLPPGLPIKANLPYDWSLNYRRAASTAE